MSKWKNFLIILAFICVGFSLWLKIVVVSPQDYSLQADVQVIKNEYFDHQELLDGIAQALMENEEIISVSVSPYMEGMIELYTAGGKDLLFESNYPTLYSNVKSLLSTGFEWTTFSRSYTQENVVQCQAFHRRYDNSCWSTFSLYFYNGLMPKTDGATVYFEQLSDSCLLVVETYELE